MPGVCGGNSLSQSMSDRRNAIKTQFAQDSWKKVDKLSTRAGCPSPGRPGLSVAAFGGSFMAARDGGILHREDSHPWCRLY